ncbi:MULTISPECIES: hypothetical protein [unclassified Kaistella]|uniref:hypothetical protein n=1 Tax=unclassified Kaistella TaxID=2762626 RepID=UPI00273697D6|nr:MULTISPECIES: hypothetical protein [unclassified Kaistella]MDP2453479.1 hypothetical protein [Kaistella sp. SH11-4b]MDP2456536.1 hypothetical protein [Kaistella sp. SH40-3]MDP2459292.1 hypothetical protein [Kaistella sp. SH19-2b]
MKSIKKHTQNLYVSLGSETDVIRFSQLSNNAQLEELMKPAEFLYIQIKDLKEAKIICQNFIEYFNLGGSNWIGGRIIDEDNNFIASISYNGKIWDNEDWKLAKEIEIC